MKSVFHSQAFVLLYCRMIKDRSIIVILYINRLIFTPGKNSVYCFQFFILFSYVAFS